MTIEELEWWIWKMTHCLGVVLCGLLFNLYMNTWRLGICIAFHHCLLLGSMWSTSWKRSLAWAKEMKSLLVWWKHNFICIIKRDHEWSKHGWKIEEMTYQLCTMRKRRNEKYNLNIDYSFTENNSSEMLSNKFFNLFVVSVVWCKSKSRDH